MLELINRARANPTAEAARLGSEARSQPGYWGSFTGFNSYEGFAGAASLNEGPPQLGGAPYTIPPAAKQPLAFNADMMDAARAYVALMQARDSTGHSIDGASVYDRMSSQGYDTELPLSSSQNNYVPGSENNSYLATSHSFDTGVYPGDIRKEAISVMHHLLFTDSSHDRGHRLTLMTADWQEAGVALDFGTDGGFSSAYGNHVFGFRTDRGPFITGVAYNDRDGDGFYTPQAGEALGDLRVIVYSTGTQTPIATTTTFASGGYGVIVPAHGTYDVRFVGSDIDETTTGIAVAAENVKVDAIDPGMDGGTPNSSDLEVTGIVISNGNVTVTWASSAGESYHVFTSTNLTDWSEISDSETTATGVVTNYTHAGGASAAQRFYRVHSR